MTQLSAFVCRAKLCEIMSHSNPLACFCLAMLLAGRAAGADTNATTATNAITAPAVWLAQPMSLADAIRIGLMQNRDILKGQRDLEAAYGVVVQTRAIAYPKLRGSSSYQHNDAVEDFPFPTTHDIRPPRDEWSGTIRLVQTIYEGGRIRSALRSARLTKEQAVLEFRGVVANTLLALRVAYFDVLEAEQQIVVQEASVKLLTQELENATHRFDAGTVPRFDVLRAEVEVVNARPKLIRAKNQYRITKSFLANLLGYDIPPNIWEDIPLTLTGKLEAEPYNIELPAAIARAMENRPELGVLKKSQSLRKEDIVVAKSGYKPTLGIYGGYGARNSYYLNNYFADVAGPQAGVELTWDIFDGNLTRGKTMQAQALYERSKIDLDDATRKIELEVRTAYSTFLEAREVLESQKKVQEQAVEALRLATSRYEAGTGTQLDVLNAQTSLTQARTTQIQALHDYEVARARLRRAIGEDITQQAPEPAVKSK